jgi:hypothetical protein
MKPTTSPDPTRNVGLWVAATGVVLLIASAVVMDAPNFVTTVGLTLIAGGLTYQWARRKSAQHEPSADDEKT